MSDIVLIPLVALVSFVAGARWMWVIACRAIDEHAAETSRPYPRLHGGGAKPRYPTDLDE